MSVAQILEEVKTFPIEDLKSLEEALRLERLRRNKGVLSAEETQLLAIVNQPLPGTQRFAALSQKWETEELTDDERAELMALVEAREIQNVERAEAVQQLSELSGVPFETLWRQLMGETPTPLMQRCSTHLRVPNKKRAVALNL